MNSADKSSLLGAGCLLFIQLCILQIVFVTIKATGYVDWNFWVIGLPLMGITILLMLSFFADL